jgi:hypothetical protein
MSRPVIAASRTVPSRQEAGGSWPVEQNRAIPQPRGSAMVPFLLRHVSNSVFDPVAPGRLVVKHAQSSTSLTA